MVTYFNQDTSQMDKFTEKHSSSIDDENTVSSLSFTDLRPGAKYQFTIVAYTNVGPGPEEMISVSTPPDGNCVQVEYLIIVTYIHSLR